MKAIFGVERDAEPAVTLLKRLHFPALSVEALHMLTPTDYLTYGIDVGLTASEVERSAANQDRDARQIVAAAAAALQPEIACDTSVIFGQPTFELLRRADTIDADMIVVNAARTHSQGVATLPGSVALGVVAGARQSVLIARGAATSASASRPLRALFATDHSPYASACWEKFLALSPVGIEHIGILSAYPRARIENLEKDVRLSTTGIRVADAVRDELLKRNQQIIDRARSQRWVSGVTFDSFVTAEPVDAAIDQAMDAMSADLLILGAKGHGLLERLTLGSVSTYQAIAGVYSTLVMRS